MKRNNGNGTRYAALNARHRDGSFGGETDGFIARFSSSGQLQWSSFYGGDGGDEIHDLVFDNNGNLFIAGETSSSVGFPIESGGGYDQNVEGGGDSDAFIARFSSSLSHNWCSYYGGDGTDVAYALEVDAQDNVFIAGSTSSGTAACSSCLCDVPGLGEFPQCPESGGYFQGSSIFGTGDYGGGDSDGFFAKFNSALELIWGTYYGGNQMDKISDLDIEFYSDRIFFAGETYSDGDGYILEYCGEGGDFWHNDDSKGGVADGVVGMFATDPSLRIWSTFYGGENLEHANAIAVFGPDESNRHYYITGYSASDDFYQYSSTSSPGAGYQYCCPNAWTMPSAGAPGNSFLVRFSGNTHFMSVESLASSQTSLSITAFPNPTNYGVTIQFVIESPQEVYMEIHSIMGQRISSSSLGVQSGATSEYLDFKDFPEGVYIVSLRTEYEYGTIKAIKR